MQYLHSHSNRFHSENRRKDANIHAVSGIWTHDLSDQAIKAYVSDRAATGIGYFLFLFITFLKRTGQTSIEELYDSLFIFCGLFYDAFSVSKTA
jgi:hypothetical protein